MPQPTDPEHLTQKRLLNQLNLELGWRYLGNWQSHRTNRVVEEAILTENLLKRGYSATLTTRAVEVLRAAVTDQSSDLYTTNKAVYQLLRYGAPVKPSPTENEVDVHFIDWGDPQLNAFNCAEEVTIHGAENTKRPDVVLYVNGIALGVIELKSCPVSVADGIRQNIGNQSDRFIRPFFHAMQLVMAANESQGLRYGTTETIEKYYLTWKDQAPTTEPNLLRRHVAGLLAPARFLEICRHFILFDAGVKKICRPHQFFGIQAAIKRINGARPPVQKEESKSKEGEPAGGIIWHTQGSGKSLTMVWLAKWIVEHVDGARVLVITDRDELDKQIVGVFNDAGRPIRRARSGADLISLLNQHEPSLICSLVHKFGHRAEGEGGEDDFVKSVRASLPAGFRAKGKIFVFVDECHRTQSGKLNEAMKEAILPAATYIGFTGTPLKTEDKKKSIEIFGPYIGRPYKFDEAVEDGVVLDLRYEARDISQRISSQERVDQWFDSRTRGLNDVARHQIKQKWGTMQKVLSSKSRLDQIVSDVCLDFMDKPRLETGRGNALLVAGSVYEACRYYELFQQTEMAGHCAIVTSYTPYAGSISKEDSGEGNNEELIKYEIYQKMLGGDSPEDFERKAKDAFVKEPGRMKLLIVVDKLLTGFDAPSATYLYIDKSMRDHGLFQAICRVNRLDGEGKDYGYVVDYKDLFKSLEKSIKDYTTEAFAEYDAADVAELLKDRVASGRERLDDALDACEATVEPVGKRDLDLQLNYFCGREGDESVTVTELEQRRKVLYKLTAELSRAYAALASDLDEAGYSRARQADLTARVQWFEKLRKSAQLRSGDYVDLKRYEAGMRRLIDLYITAEPSRKVSNLDDLSLIQLIVERGAKEAVEELPEEIASNEDSVAETIQNNVRQEIVEKQPGNPAFFSRMSALLQEIIELRESKAIDYAEYLRQIEELTRKMAGGDRQAYPTSMQSQRQRAIYDYLGHDEALSLAAEAQIRYAAKDGWRHNAMKRRGVEKAIARVLDGHAAFDAAALLAIIEAN
ncbi:type I restriction endonuclease subunit R [Neolewinella antarctica]|uniref:Type I restriction enzyme endonuclease subunit n=1 Tax=Neolewinella antarctica TaxID=442734 RepID=A0ABX0XG49_9BACT|nr:type I restriction endonuclease subunit R [Neolewinella antarctica]NJC27854.1 type I restriction enzyme R subunit [Neolewinella antarctica]